MKKFVITSLLMSSMIMSTACSSTTSVTTRVDEPDTVSTETGDIEVEEDVVEVDGTDASIIQKSEKNVNDTDLKTEESTTENIATEVEDNAMFAKKLYDLMDKDENKLLSPLSLKYAMAMTANGADNETQKEIIDALGISDLGVFNVEAKKYIESLAVDNDQSDIEVIEPDSDNGLSKFSFTEESYEGPKFSIANSIWLNTRNILDGGDFSDYFKFITSNYYNAEAKQVSNSEAVEAINNWCDVHTNGKIDKIIESSDFDAALVNAIYFKGRWDSEFEKSGTSPDIFYNYDGTETEVDFMHQIDSFNYYEDDDIQIISLPYDYSSISMYLALADDDIDPLDYTDKLELKKVILKMPKFKTTTSIDAGEVFNDLGVTKAFENATGSHFKDMFNDIANKSIAAYISQILHKTYIDVNEEGTEAAAVTAVVLDTAAMIVEPEEIYEFSADRPFTYFIRDNSNGEILFLGRYASGIEYEQ